MTVTPRQARRVTDFLFGKVQDRRLRRVHRFLWSLVPVRNIPVERDPAAELEVIFTQQHLALAGEVHRVDRRGPAAGVIRARHRMIIDGFRQEFAR